MNKIFAFLLTLTTYGCGPHHVSTVMVSTTKYTCVNWFQTIAICDTVAECNKTCAEAAGRK